MEQEFKSIIVHLWINNNLIYITFYRNDKGDKKVVELFTFPAIINLHEHSEQNPRSCVALRPRFMFGFLPEY